MAESNNNKEWIYILVGVGITLLAVATILSFLTYRKVDRDRQSYSMQQPLSISQLSPTMDVPVQNQNPTYPIYHEKDERLYQLLENQQNQLEHINSNINSLRSLNYTPYKMPNQRDVTNAANMANINKLSTPRAGSVTTIRTGNEDKTRQKEFGMI